MDFLAFVGFMTIGLFCVAAVVLLVFIIVAIFETQKDVAQIKLDLETKIAWSKRKKRGK